MAIFGGIMTVASRPALYDVHIIHPSITSEQQEGNQAPQLFYNVNLHSALAIHWGIAFTMIFFTGPSQFYILLSVTFKGLQGATNQLQIITASLLMGFLIASVYSFQTFLYVTSETYYYECLNPTYAALRYTRFSHRTFGKL